MDYRLLNSQKTDVFNAIRQHGLDPLSFLWADTQSRNPGTGEISIIQFGNEPSFYFEFDHYADKYVAACSPWREQRETRFTVGSWPAVPKYVGDWVGFLKRELTTADPWKALPGYTNVADLRLAPDVANTQFAFGETEKVAAALSDIRQLLGRHVQGSQAKTELIDAELKNLIESSKRMGRKDWFNIAIGTLINLAIAIALPPEVTRQAFEILRDALGGIVHFLPPIIATGSQLLG